MSQAYFSQAITHTFFTPLIEPGRHTPRKPISYLTPEGIYAEYNSSWYLRHYPTKYVDSYDDFMRFVFGYTKRSDYVYFAPGANYIVPKANILRYSKTFYENVRIFVSHTEGVPGESHLLERVLYELWKDGATLNPAPHMNIPLPATFKKIPHMSVGVYTHVKNTIYRLIAVSYSLAAKVRHIHKKLPSLLQYLQGKRNPRDLYTRLTGKRL